MTSCGSGEPLRASVSGSEIGAEDELRSHPACFEFLKLDPRDKPEDDRATTIATTS